MTDIQINDMKHMYCIIFASYVYSLKLELLSMILELLSRYE